ncbi:MAG: PspA/IM30 family protein [Limnospira sp.]
MKPFIDWLMGDRAGKMTISAWNWLWGISETEEDPPDSLEVAEASLQTLQETVKQLAQVVSTQVEVYRRAKQRYEAKVRELKGLEQKAIAAQQNGDTAGARLAMSNLIQIEKILPQLEERVQQAENYVNLSQAKLNQERLQLETAKIELDNLKDLQEINEALEAIAKVNDEFDINSARSQFERAKNEVEMRSLEQQALAELSLNSGEVIPDDDPSRWEETVSQRLKKLDENH